MAQAEELGETEEEKHPEKTRFCHPGYLVSLPGFLRILNIVSLASKSWQIGSKKQIITS